MWDKTCCGTPNLLWVEGWELQEWEQGVLTPPHLPRLQRAGKGWLRVIKERDRKTLLKELSGKGAISGLLCASARDLGPEQTIAERSSGLLQQVSQPEGCEGHEEHKGPLPGWDGDQAGSFGTKEEKRSLNEKL